MNLEISMKKNISNNIFARVILALSLSLTPSCQKGDDKKDSEPPLDVVDPSVRGASFKILDVNIPSDTQGRYTLIGEAAFAGGNLSGDIWTYEAPKTFDIQAEERVAAAENVFLTGPGFVFEIFPAGTGVSIELSSPRGSQTISKTSDEKGRLAVSLFNFSSIFPPAYRERYELKVSSKEGSSGKTFSYAYSFAVRLASGTLVYASVSSTSKPKAFKLGEDNKGFPIASIGASAACSDCLMEIKDLKGFGRVKYFVETPSVPDAASELGITWPRRFAGLLVKEIDVEVSAIAVGNGSASVSIQLDVPAQSTTVSPWCSKRSLSEASAKCPVTTSAGTTTSFFGFVNIVPSRLSEGLLGGSSGVARFVGGATATLIVKRGGIEVERRQISFDSGAISPLDSLALPPGAMDVIKNALLSGAPEFALE